MKQPASVHIEGLHHRYPGASTLALQDVSLHVSPGQRVGLLGPNGAGKTTLMRILCGFLPVQDHAVDGARRAPRVAVGDFDVRTDSLQVRTCVGYLPEHVPLYTELRVREHLSFRARVKRVPRAERKAEIERVAQMTGLRDKLETPISHLSRGYRQRVGIADALLGNPPLVILDEPTVGLDPNQVLEIRAMLRDLGGDHTLVFSSHILAEVEALCDHVVILSRGRVVVDEPLADALAAGYVEGQWVSDEPSVHRMLQDVWGELSGSRAPAVELIAAHEGLVRAKIFRPAQANVGELLRAIGRYSLEHRLPVVSLAPSRTRLEERFAEVTGIARDDA